MFNLFWAGIARLLFRWTWLTEKLILSALDRPHHKQLDDYMNRWWVLPRTKWLPFAIRLHLIKRADHGRHLHNHPGDFRTFVLRGWYVEKRGGKYKTLNAGQTNFVPKEAYHEIAAVAENGVLTMVIEYGRWKGKPWGFDVDGTHVDHEFYPFYDER